MIILFVYSVRKQCKMMFCLQTSFYLIHTDAVKATRSDLLVVIYREKFTYTDGSTDGAPTLSLVLLQISISSRSVTHVGWR